MLQYGFLERRSPAPTIEQVLRFKRAEEHDVPDLVTIESHAKVGARDRPDAALLDLAAAGRAQRPVETRSRTSSVRCRSAACSTASSRTPTR
jgi:hypothetical protein